MKALIKLLELLGENINNKEKMIEIIETLEKDLTINLNKLQLTRKP